MEITDRTAENRFVGTEDGHDAQLVYRVDGDRLVLTETEVPEDLQGRGLGGQLVRAALERAASSGEMLVPECPYARSWLRKHDEVASRVRIEWPAEPED